MKRVLVVVAVLATTRSAQAADAHARAAESYRAAEDAYRHGAFQAAARAFEAAYADDPRGATIYNAAISWDAAEDEPRAADDFARARAADDLAPAQRQNATARLRHLESVTGRLDVRATTPVPISVGHVDHGGAPLEVHLRPGTWAVRVDRPGESEPRSVDVRAGEITTIDIPEARVAEARPIVHASPPTHVEAPSRVRRPLPWAALGAAALFAGTAVFLGSRMLDERSIFEGSGRTDTDAHASAIHLRTWTNVSWIGSGVLLATSVTTFVW